MTVVYTPGKYMYTADALSRNYDENTGDEISKITEEVSAHVHGVMAHIKVTPDRLSEIKAETHKDNQMQILAQVILLGWPDEKHKCPDEVVEYWNYRDELCVIDGIIFKGSRVIIPSITHSSSL